MTLESSGQQSGSLLFRFLDSRAKFKAVAQKIANAIGAR